MPTAPSFSKFKRLSEPFFKDGKMYITVEHPNTHNQRNVRWYSDAEYAKNYGKKETADDGFDNLKFARGFSKGPVLCVRGVRGPADENWLKKSKARYAVGMGWHFVSTDTLPEDAPAHFKYVVLGWNEARDLDDRHIKNPKELAEIITEKLRADKVFKVSGDAASCKI